MCWITNLKFRLINSEDCSEQKAMIKKINLSYLKEHLPVLYFEASIYQALIHHMDNETEKSIEILVKALNFMKLYQNFKKW